MRQEKIVEFSRRFEKLRVNGRKLSLKIRVFICSGAMVLVATALLGETLSFKIPKSFWVIAGIILMVFSFISVVIWEVKMKKLNTNCPNCDKQIIYDSVRFVQRTEMCPYCKTKILDSNPLLSKIAFE